MFEVGFEMSRTIVSIHIQKLFIVIFFQVPKKRRTNTLHSNVESIWCEHNCIVYLCISIYKGMKFKFQYVFVGAWRIDICYVFYWLLFQMRQNDLPKTMFIIFYSTCMVSEVFVPSYFGTALRTNADSFPYNAFKSNWITQDQRFKKTLMILVERLLRPFEIQVARIFALGLSSFIQVQFDVKIPFEKAFFK